MRELQINDLSLTSIGGGMTENQCIAAFAAGGGLFGYLGSGGNSMAALGWMAVGTTVGGILCADLLGTESDGS